MAGGFWGAEALTRPAGLRERHVATVLYRRFLTGSLRLFQLTLCHSKRKLLHAPGDGKYGHGRTAALASDHSS
jgi:hypothetical protein